MAIYSQLVLLASGCKIVLAERRFVALEIRLPAAGARNQQDLVLRHVVHHSLQGGDALGHQQLPAVLGAAGEVQRVAVLLHGLGRRSIASCREQMISLDVDAVIVWNSISAPASMPCGVKLNTATKQHTNVLARDMVVAQCRNWSVFCVMNKNSYHSEGSILEVSRLLSLNISSHSQQNFLISLKVANY